MGSAAGISRTATKPGRPSTPATASRLTRSTPKRPPGCGRSRSTPWPARRSTMDRITTPFGAQSTAAEVVAGIDLSGRRAIVTGGASGIGIETARALAGAGAQVTIAVRNVEAGNRTAGDIAATTGNDRVRVAPLDLADRASVASFVAAWEGPLHILVNNA